MAAFLPSAARLISTSEIHFPTNETKKNAEGFFFNVNLGGGEGKPLFATDRRWGREKKALFIKRKRKKTSCLRKHYHMHGAVPERASQFFSFSRGKMREIVYVRLRRRNPRTIPFLYANARKRFLHFLSTTPKYSK